MYIKNTNRFLLFLLVLAGIIVGILFATGVIKTSSSKSSNGGQSPTSTNGGTPSGTGPGPAPTSPPQPPTSPSKPCYHWNGKLWDKTKSCGKSTPGVPRTICGCPSCVECTAPQPPTSGPSNDEFYKNCIEYDGCNFKTGYWPPCQISVGGPTYKIQGITDNKLCFPLKQATKQTCPDLCKAKSANAWKWDNPDDSGHSPEGCYCWQTTPPL